MYIYLFIYSRSIAVLIYKLTLAHRTKRRGGKGNLGPIATRRKLIIAQPCQHRVVVFHFFLCATLLFHHLASTGQFYNDEISVFFSLRSLRSISWINPPSIRSSPRQSRNGNDGFQNASDCKC